MSVEIRFVLKTSKVMDFFAFLAGRVTDMTPAMIRAAKYMKSSVRRRISRGKVAPDGTPWAPLSQATEELRGRIAYADGARHSDRHFLPGNVLVATGALMRGIDVKYATAKSFAIQSLRPEGDPRVPFVMNKGWAPTSGMIPGKRIPARPYMGFSAENEKQIKKIIHDYVLHGRL